MANDISLTQPDLIDRLLAGLPAGYTAATVITPNSHLKVPANTKWLRATVLTNETINATPDGYKRTLGFFVVDLFFVKGSGDKAQLTDAKAIQDLFDNKEFGNTRTQTSSIVGGIEDGSWFKMQVSTEFLYEGV